MKVGKVADPARLGGQAELENDIRARAHDVDAEIAAVAVALHQDMTGACTTGMQKG